MRVLVADDSPVSRQVVTRMLERWGYEVETVADGEEAYRRLSAPDAPRLALLDWVMPGLDGVEVCRRLRAEEGEHRPFLYLLTARNGTHDLLAGLEAGADDYLTKPVVADELLHRLRNGERLLSLQAELAAARRALRSA